MSALHVILCPYFVCLDNFLIFFLLQWMNNKHRRKDGRKDGRIKHTRLQENISHLKYVWFPGIKARKMHWNKASKLHRKPYVCTYCKTHFSIHNPWQKAGKACQIIFPKIYKQFSLEFLLSFFLTENMPMTMNSQRSLLTTGGKCFSCVK